MNDFLKIAEELDWSYNVDDTPNERGEVCVELEKYSPQDQDFIATIWFENGNKSDFMDKLYQYYSDFDPETRKPVNGLARMDMVLTARHTNYRIFCKIWRIARICY